MPSFLLHEPLFQADSLLLPYQVNGHAVSYTVMLPAPVVKNEATLRIAHWLSLFFVVGLAKIDYPISITTDYPLDQSEVEFFEKLYYHGLAEFRVRNNLAADLSTRIQPSKIVAAPAMAPERALRPITNNLLVFNGGGKDGLTTATILAQSGISFDWLNVCRSIGVPDGAQRNALVAFPDVRSWTVARYRNSIKNYQKYRGHTPLNAGLALFGTLSALALDKQYIAASNELSANDGNGVFDGVTVNHQYSKSLEFENDFRTLLATHNIPVTYFSFLRPLQELQIMRVFSRFENLHKHFSSCNRRLGSGKWCLNCPKCAFVTMSLAAFNPTSAQQLWGKGFLNTKEMITNIKDLIDPSSPKPFDCVGTLDECQIALKLVLDQPELELSEAFRQTLSPFLTNLRSDAVQHFFAQRIEPHNSPSGLGDGFARLRELAAL